MNNSSGFRLPQKSTLAQANGNRHIGVGRRPNRKLVASKSRRNAARRNRSQNTMAYTCNFSIDRNDGTRPLLASSFGIDVSRPCRIKYIKVIYSSAKNVGMCFSFTVESATSDGDAVNRSKALLLTTFPRQYVLHAPRSTDFAYISVNQAMSEFTVYPSVAASDISYSFFLVTLSMEFKNMQPLHKDLGLLPPRKSDLPRTHIRHLEQDGDELAMSLSKLTFSARCSAASSSSGSKETVRRSSL